MRYINGTRLDDRIVRVDWDAGFIEGRQYGRGKSGGQVRDEYRTDFDSGRGGYGKFGHYAAVKTISKNIFSFFFKFRRQIGRSENRTKH